MREQVEPNETITVQWRGQLALDIPPSVTTITNVAQATSPDSPGPITATASTALLEPALTLTLHCPAYTQAGETILYQAGVTNIGPETVRGLEARAPISTGVTYLPGSATASGSLNGTTLDWQLDTLAAGGTVDLSWAVQVASDLEGEQLEATLAIEAAGRPVVEQACQTALFVPALTVSKTASSHVALNEVVDYTLTVRNTGLVTAYNTLLTDTLPLGATYLPGSASAGADVRPETILWQLGHLASGQGLTRRYQMRSLIPETIPAGTQLYNQAGDLLIFNQVQASADRAAPVATDTLTLSPRPVLSLTKIATPQAGPGDPITYTLTARNEGPGRARQVVLADHLPAGLIVLENTLDSQGYYDPELHQVAWPLGDLPPGGCALVPRWAGCRRAGGLPGAGCDHGDGDFCRAGRGWAAL